MLSRVGKRLPVIFFALVSASAWSQTTPDAGALLRETERQQTRPLPHPMPQGVPAAPIKPADEGARVFVKVFRFTGHTLIGEADLQQAVAAWVNRESSFAELQQAVNAVAEEYRRRGWFVRPLLPAQDVENGTIHIQIIEGRLGAVRIDDQGKDLRIERGFVAESMTARQKPGDILNLELLDRSTNLLNDTPGVTVATILAPGKNDGEADAVVKVQDKALIAGTLQIDNQGARSTGEQKTTFSASLDNPSGIGDQASLNANDSQGSRYAKLAYTVPFGHDGLRLGASTSAMVYRVLPDTISPGDPKTKGDAQTWGVNTFYPLVRQATKNLSLSLALDRKDYHNETDGAVTSEKRIYSAIASVSGDMLDGLGAGGMTLVGLNLTWGNVNLDAAPTNASTDLNGAKTAGVYQKLGINVSRLQRLSDKATLWATVNTQFAGKNLDSSEKMGLGGPTGVRAYPVIEGSGDEGWQGTLEARYNLLPELQIAAFYDHGRIRQVKNPNYTGTPTPGVVELKGQGISVAWNQPGNFSLRAVIAQRSGGNPLHKTDGRDSDGTLDRTRIWLTAVKFF